MATDRCDIRQKELRKARVLVFGHDADYYVGRDCQKQVVGMQGYFSNFPDCPAEAGVMRLIRSFRFSLAVPQHDLAIESTDERLALVYAVCRHLDGAIFTPSSLRDADGRILIGAEGYSDPNAVLPTLPPTADHPIVTSDDDDDDNDDDECEPPSASAGSISDETHFAK